MKFLFNLKSLFLLSFFIITLFQIFFILSLKNKVIKVYEENIPESCIKSSSLIIYPSEQIRFFRKKGSMLKVSRVSSGKRYFNVPDIYSACFLTIDSPEEPINLSYYNKKELGRIKDAVFYKFNPHQKEVLNNISELAVSTVFNHKEKNINYLNHKFQYGKNDWDSIEKKTLKYQGENIECIWIHPENDFFTKIRWKSREKSKLLFYLIMADSGSDTAEYSMGLYNGTDGNYLELRGSDLKHGYYRLFDVDNDDDFSFEIKASQKERHHLCFNIISYTEN